MTYDGDIEWHIFGQITIKLHIAVHTDTADDTMADLGVFPKRVAKFADFPVFQAFGTVAPVQAILIRDSVVAFLHQQR